MIVAEVQSLDRSLVVQVLCGCCSVNIVMINDMTVFVNMLQSEWI